MYDNVYKIAVNEGEVEYGCVSGNGKIVYIKAGMGGNFLGYEDKYLKIARGLNERFGCSVICASNPCPLPILADKMIIDEFLSRHKTCTAELFFFGHSNGGVKGLELAASGVPFERMVLVNMPLMINFNKALGMMKAIPDTKIIAAYGDGDPSVGFIPFLLSAHLPNLEILKIPGADHNFSGALDKFISLADYAVCDNISITGYQ